MRTSHVALVVVAAMTTSPALAEPIGETFFEFDSSALRATAERELQQVAEQATDTPDTRVVLAGHADPRGTGPYNVGLSTRRAESVRAALIEEGVPEERIVIAVYGEDAPSRGSHAEDRRVSIFLTANPLYEIIDNRLGPATAIVWDTPVTVAELDGPPREETARR